MKATMKMKCPECFGEKADCDKCGGSGYVDAKIADGVIYTRLCNACGFQNGGRVTGPGLPALPEKPDPCIQCHSPDVVWLEVGRT